MFRLSSLMGVLTPVAAAELNSPLQWWWLNKLRDVDGRPCNA
jgi:hypothetical protein